MKISIRTLCAAFAFVLGVAAPFDGARRCSAAETFSDISTGIKFARENKRLIVFVLGRSFNDETKEVQGIVSEELVLHTSEFIVVHCDQAGSANRALFTERFKQDIAKLPIAVVTDAQGNLIEVTSGTDRETYTQMIKMARVKTGLETDPQKIAALSVDSSEIGYINADGVFGMKKSDVASSKIALTKVRMWRFKNEAVLEAALLEAKDAIGVFIKPDGTTVEARFDTLSDNDIAFIQQALVGGKVIAP